ncbi:hypothetical protein E2C01_021571 [Portunus trituberculatus]|uniref:Uncharacterized protein n=1 Tax=Portunus trituberculatus TaxID=210409 RepID=A0A5B7E3M6_PORTR|nr:hypothetical protein [Portunus trituberculatus]
MPILIPGFRDRWTGLACDDGSNNTINITAITIQRFPTPLYITHTSHNHYSHHYLQHHHYDDHHHKNRTSTLVITKLSNEKKTRHEGTSTSEHYQQWAKTKTHEPDTPSHTKADLCLEEEEEEEDEE